MKSNTIAAIATPMTNSGIGIIRISGDQALDIIEKVFKPKKIDKKIKEVKTYTAHYGHVYDGETLLDECIVLVMKGPHSYTAEDVVEINCHGGVVVMKKVLEAVFKAGAAPAEPGEFTKRAFLNGRIDLSEAEAVMDLIQSKNEFAMSTSLKQLEGALGKKITEIRKQIIHSVAFIESALDDPEHYSVDGFSDELREQVEKIIKQGNLPGVLGEKHASGTEIIKELGEEHLKTGKPIIYTSADSVLQIAAHEEVFGLERLYELCKICYELVKPYHIARVIARPFVGTRAEDFVRTGNRHDYAVPAPADTLLDKLVAAGGSVYAVGKIADIFAHRGITKHYPASGLDKLFAAALQAVQEAPDNSLVFVNFVDFDSSFGHRRDVEGYGEGLEYFDDRLPELLRLLKQDDLLLVTADHGCDPTWSGSDHTREKIPVLFFGKNIVSKDLLPMRTFSDIGQTIAVHLGIERLANGKAAELR